MKTILLLVLVFLYSTGDAQFLPSEKYTSKNGLVSDRVTAIVQDEKGFMWFGTFFGISRYDGTSFQKIHLPAEQQNKYVNCLLASNNKIYAGFMFSGGLAEYDNGKVQSHFIKGRDSTGENEFLCMNGNEDGSIILVNSSNGIYEFANGKFRFIYRIKKPRAGFARQVLKDRKGNIWVAMDQGLLVLPHLSSHEQFYYQGDNINSLYADRKGTIWFSRFTGEKTFIHTIDGLNEKGLMNDQVLGKESNLLRVPYESNGKSGFWAINTKKGLMSIEPDRKNHFYQLPLDFNSDIRKIYKDREENIWIANEPGLLKISSFHIQSYYFKEIAAGGGCILPQSNSAWASNSKSLYRIHSNSIEKVAFQMEKPDYIGDLFEDSKGNLWICLWNGGLYCTRWKNDRLIHKKFYHSFRGKIIAARNITEDSEGNIWVAGSEGVFRIRDLEVKENFNPPDKNGDPSFISCMSLDEKNRTLWLGHNSLGIIRVKYEPADKKAYKYQVENYIGKENGLKDSYMRSLAADPYGNLWAGTRYGGIFLIKKQGKSNTVTDCNQQAGLGCTRIASISVEDSTAVWFAACDGIYRYGHSDSTWSQLNPGEGLLNSEVFHTAIDKTNRFIWILTSEGITRMNLEAPLNQVQPLISITSVNILGKPDSGALYSKKPSLYSFDRNSIGFSFAGASFIDEKKILYKYMLEGHDEDWSKPVVHNQVNYASLPPGDYVFKVMAANANGIWSKEPASFRFRITIPLYKQPWFIFLGLSLVLFIFYLVRIQRLKHNFKIEKIRLNIARDLHDDIGSTLGSINLLSKTASRKLEKLPVSEDISPIFNKISHSAESILDAMDDIVWAINPAKDKMGDLLIRMREFAFPLLEAGNIEFSFLNEGSNDQVVPMKLRRTVFLIFKESVYNILKHSEATRVDIRIQIVHHQLVMRIADNGKGFDAGIAQGRNGLNNMQQRAVSGGGNLEIKSSSNGTEVRFMVPIR